MYDRITELENAKDANAKHTECPQQEDKYRTERSVVQHDRKKIIGQAIRDLKVLTDSLDTACDVSFYESEDGRKTTCVIFNRRTNDYSVGRAYLSKDDKREYEIGAVIALRRASNMPVPKEYLNLPKEGE